MTVSIPAALPEDGSSFRGDRAAIQTGGGANDEMLELIPSELVLLGSILVVAAAAVATVHAALYKDEVRTAIGWVAVIVLVPFVGTLLYYLIGINRIRRRAVALRRENERSMLPLPPGWLRPTQVGEILGGSADAAAVANVVGKLTGRPLLGGNRIRPLQNGDEAYPAMLDAIASSTRSVTLQTYIFDNDRWGKRFVESLAAAQSRGVEVRVLIDAVGSRYSRPPVTRLLREGGIPSALFLKAGFSTLFFPSFNLRNHRKVLVVDGRIGFTGGMNIREDFVLGDPPRHPGFDLHFQVEGPVVRDLQEIFAEDWEFTTGEALWGQDWFPRLSPAGAVHRARNLGRAGRRPRRSHLHAPWGACERAALDPNRHSLLPAGPAAGLCAQRGGSRRPFGGHRDSGNGKSPPRHLGHVGPNQAGAAARLPRVALAGRALRSLEESR